ncbi:TrmH family RNA methyltransferase [Paenisporosarcina cavernae]|uniref:RNA methyltransferase n=1 Tax=Paenisporosarcina cavernae TaxID=2320858 RepID=A0A385YV73_9BACL|nr:RNA methyltransferase [Paenisporosarcina cavernae]AYC29807.1 RNA methyltransferase [Paenisporosarcina cavernae]
MKKIESSQNGLVKHWRKLVSTRKEREKHHEFLVEGHHLVEEALKTPENVLTLIIREGTDLPFKWNLDGISIIEVTHEISKELTDTEHSQGIFAHCKQPTFDLNKETDFKKFLLIDAVQDPGNVGTMIRTADAAGIDAVILGKGTADAYNPKTIRSAQGSHFHLPIVRGELMEWVEKLQSKNIQVYGTSLARATSVQEIQKTDSFALIMGNEGAGLSPELLEATNLNVKIPILGKAESLNVAVATGILLYHLTDFSSAS